jgi:DNA invertase Pin-like site-specific DNA recombinase
MLMQMVGSFAEFERAMIRERTHAGLAAARARGRIGGRRPTLGPAQQAEVVAMVTSGRKTQAEAARVFQVHPATVSRLLAAQRQHTHAPVSPLESPAARGAPSPRARPRLPTAGGRLRASRQAPDQE